jgi:hypothetical protein
MELYLISPTHLVVLGLNTGRNSNYALHYRKCNWYHKLICTFFLIYLVSQNIAPRASHYCTISKPYSLHNLLSWYARNNKLFTNNTDIIWWTTIGCHFLYVRWSCGGRHITRAPTSARWSREPRNVKRKLSDNRRIVSNWTTRYSTNWWVSHFAVSCNRGQGMTVQFTIILLNQRDKT